MARGTWRLISGYEFALTEPLGRMIEPTFLARFPRPLAQQRFSHNHLIFHWVRLIEASCIEISKIDPRSYEQLPHPRARRFVRGSFVRRPRRWEIHILLQQRALVSGDERSLVQRAWNCLCSRIRGTRGSVGT